MEKVIRGEDSSTGEVFVNTDHLWAKEFDPEFAKKQGEITGKQTPCIGSKDNWYNGSVNYWN
jgi:hypothetical protein